MSNSDEYLVCRDCQVLPELVQEDGQPDRIRCPECEAQGNSEKVTKLATEYKSSQLIDEFQNTIAKSVSGSQYISYKRGSRKRVSTPQFIFAKLS